MTTLTVLYGSSTAINCTTTSLASDATLLAGRQSAVVNNSSTLAVDYMLGGTIVTTSTPTANTVVELWLFGSWDNGTTYSAGMGAGDANVSPATTGSKNLMALAVAIQQTDTTARTYTVGPISVAQTFGGVMPDHWGFYVVQNTGQTLGATTLTQVSIKYSSA